MSIGLGFPSLLRLGDIHNLRLLGAHGETTQAQSPALGRLACN